VVSQRQRRTQMVEYWRDEFAVNKEDVEYLYEWLVEEGEPRALDDLSLKLVERRCQKEEIALSKQHGGQIYSPQETYEIDQSVVFPAFEYAIGKVLSVREGNNPRYGAFKVMRVQLEGEETQREFASEFAPDHLLRRNAPSLEDGSELASPMQLCLEHGSIIRKRVEDALRENDDFLCQEGAWFLKGLMPEVTPFQMNIAEAVIDERRGPVPVAQLAERVSQELEEMGTPAPGKSTVRTYAMVHALGKDPRFVEIKSDGASSWYLSDAVPEAVRHKPGRLAPMCATHGREMLNRELRDFALGILDEADELDSGPAVFGNLNSAQIALTFPHRREGTFPLSKRVLGLLAEKPPADRFMVTFVDEKTGESLAGWMVPVQGYAWGLGEWYRRHELPVGSIIELRRGDAPLTFRVSCDGKRKSDWVREAKVVAGRLVFSIQRKAYACRFDKHLVIDEGNVDDLDRLWVSAGADPLGSVDSLFDHLSRIFPELAKLSGQGLVHAKTLYSAVNLTRRCGAVPVFAELTRRACFDPVGDGNWVYDESLRNVVYDTPEDMSRRPSSHRQDLIVDRVYPYGVSTNEVKDP